MKLLRLWRQYDSIKAMVLLTASALFLIGYCIRMAAEYAAFLRTPIEYICTASAELDKVLPQLANTDGIRSYTRQKTAYLTEHEHGINITLLSEAYLSDCYGLDHQARTIFMNPAAFSAFCGTDAQSPVSFRGTLDRQSYSAQIVCKENLPSDEPFAAVAVTAAELHDADTLRICMTEQEAFVPESVGLTLINPEVQNTAAYEQKLVLLRIRFAAFSAFFATLAAAAFLKIYKLHQRASYETIHTDLYTFQENSSLHC